MNELIKIKDLCFSYGKTEVLKNLNLIINQGDFLGIIGSNGSGKSTLIKLLVSELKNFTGSIEIFGEDILAFKDWSKIGYVAQIDRGKTIAFPISVRELITLNLYSDFNIFNHPRKKHTQIVNDIVRILNIENLIDKNFNDLSGGQKQKVMIAKALVHNPSLLIFDEPTVGVDEKSKREFFDMLEHINQFHGITIIMVTHEMDLADEYFTRKVVLKDKGIYG